MNHTIFMAYAGLRSRAQALEVMTNNIANINTTGFKGQKPFFHVRENGKSESFSQLAEAITGPIVDVGSGTDFSVGQLKETGNPLDLALTGEGFFVVETPQGLRYTRNGSFRLNKSRELITGEGFNVIAEGNPKQNKEPRKIVLGEGSVDVSQNGQIAVDGVMSAKLKLVAFKDLTQLRRVGGSFFEAPAQADEIPPANSQVAAGFLEQANVNAVKNLSEVVSLMRSFEMLTRAIRSLTNNVDQKVINDVGKV
jgi:flagellar basal-body rod protein FlgG